MPSKSLFTIVVDPEKMNPFFRGTAIENSSEPARLMMEKVFEKFKDIDNNFVEQFQTTGFDARIFELYLFEYFSSSGFEVKRDFERPDFIISKDGVEVAIEATTTNPDPNYKKDHKSIEKILSLSDEDVERKENDEVPIRLGSSLFSKLKMRYWELEQCKNKPFVIAIEAFHEEVAFLFSDMPLAQYLYGLRHFPSWTEDGKLVVNQEEVTKHQVGNKLIPSNFFGQPDTENISAILFTNTGTHAKFSRMGYQQGFHRGNIRIYRYGTWYDSNPNSATPLMKAYDMEESPFYESWGQGLVVLHNPHALHPLSHDYFPDAAQVYIDHNVLAADLPPYHPYSTMTEVMFQVDIPIDFPEKNIAAILKSEYDKLSIDKKSTVDLLFQEKQWFSDRNKIVVGTVLMDRSDEDWCYIIFGIKSDGKYRTLEIGERFFSSRSEATGALIDTMDKICSSGKKVFE